MSTLILMHISTKLNVSKIKRTLTSKYCITTVCLLEYYEEENTEWEIDLGEKITAEEKEDILNCELLLLLYFNLIIRCRQNMDRQINLVIK